MYKNFSSNQYISNIEWLNYNFLEDYQNNKLDDFNNLSNDFNDSFNESSDNSFNDFDNDSDESSDNSSNELDDLIKHLDNLFYNCCNKEFNNSA